ncbi:MAG: hypothetical protein AUI97_04890 [Crenarchaeota archaeon 13_1_40CM_3_52_17]|nr:MAG: hypothetical protein AUI97_04890 [Crenarchaeota archaeon 13_1_40CM_3_52_17]
MKRTVFLASLPFLILASILLPVSIALPPPMTTIIFNDQRNISHSNVANRYYYAHYSVQLSAYQRAEFQFSSSQPLDFYLLDRGNFDSYISNQTNVATITYSLAELQNIHSFTPTRADTYVFMLLNSGSQDATVNVSIRRSFTGLEYIGLGIVAAGGILITLGLVLKPRAVEIPTKVLEMIKMHGRIRISELALRFSTSETDIELALLKIRRMNEPIFFDGSTREVSYLPRPRPPETPSL